MGRTVEFCALAVPESHNLLKTSSDFSKTNSEFASEGVSFACGKSPTHVYVWEQFSSPVLS